MKKRYKLPMGMWIVLDMENSSIAGRYITRRAIKKGRFEGYVDNSTGQIYIDSVTFTKWEMIVSYTLGLNYTRVQIEA